MPPNAAQLNQNMIKFIPELDSKYATYPMSFDRWLEANETSPEGTKCYLKGPNSGIKKHYIFGAGKFGFGYYHLLTKYAWQNAYSRINQSPPGGCCSFSAEARRAADQWDDVKRLMYNRSVATKPDDGVAAKDALSEAKVTANNWHNGMQNEQLAFNIVNVVNGPGAGY